jgi:hypothetical protein
MKVIENEFVNDTMLVKKEAPGHGQGLRFERLAI